MSSKPTLNRRLLLHIGISGLLGSATARLGASEPAVWLVASDQSPAYEEAATALKAEWPTANWHRLTPASLPARAAPPRLIVTLGNAAYRAALIHAANNGALAQVPVVAGLLPRASFEAVPPPRNGPPVTAIWLDPAVDRYLELIRRTMPERLRVGVLFGPTSRALRPAVVKAAYDRGLELVEASVLAEDFYPALAQVLREADVLLALPDALVYNANTLNNVLISAYRQRVPVVTYAAAHVRAGATMALHTTPSQAGRQLGALARRLVAEGRPLPPPGPATDWSLAVNTQVARSLDIGPVDSEALLNALRRGERRP